jgi:integrase
MATRRGHGDGSIYQRVVNGKPRLEGQVDLGRDPNGRRIRRTVHGTTRREVKAKLDEIRRNAQAGMIVGRETPTVGEWLTKWIEQLEAGRKNRASTVRRYGSLARIHLIPGLGHHRLDKLTRVHVDDFLSGKLRELHPRTVHHLRAVLRTALNRAVKDGRILRNAAALTDAVDVPETPKRFLTTEEAQAILNAARAEAEAKPDAERFLTAQRHALYVLALNLGPRIGEALALRWEDVKFETGKIAIIYSLQRVGGKLDPTVEPKTEKSRRRVGIPLSVVQALQAHRQRQREAKIRFRPLWGDSDLVFTTQIGSPLDPNDVSRDFATFLERNRLPKVRFHDLRHAAGSIMLKNGVPMHVVSRILGHSNIATTIDIYGHVEDGSLDDAAVRMGQALG